MSHSKNMHLLHSTQIPETSKVQPTAVAKKRTQSEKKKPKEDPFLKVIGIVDTDRLLTSPTDIDTFLYKN